MAFFSLTVFGPPSFHASRTVARRYAERRSIVMAQYVRRIVVYDDGARESIIVPAARTHRDDVHSRVSARLDIVRRVPQQNSLGRLHIRFF